MSARYPLLTSVEELIDPDRLTGMLGIAVSQVGLTSITPPFAKSGSALLLVSTNGGAGPRLVLKRVNVHRDWLMRATDDEQCRSVTVWAHRLLDRLPQQITHGILACSHDGEGFALLMRDFDGLLMSNTPFTPARNHLFLDAMAAMHAEFMNDAALGEPELGLCGLEHVYRMFSPRTGAIESGGVDEVPARIVEGWRMVREVVDRDVVDIVEPLIEDPSPLCRALSNYPLTLVHGDYRHSNLGVLDKGDTPGVILLDWQLATRGTPSVELGRYLGANSALLPGTKEQTLAYYHSSLSRQLGAGVDLSWWQPQLDLGLLGGFVQDGWAIALKATTWDVGADARDHWKADLAWWSQRVRLALRWL